MEPMAEVLTFGPTVRRDQALVLSAHRAAVGPWGFLEWFIISQVALPALLYLPGTQGLRVPIRIAPFAISLAALVWCRDRDEDSFDHAPCLPLAHRRDDLPGGDGLSSYHQFAAYRSWPGDALCVGAGARFLGSLPGARHKPSRPVAGHSARLQWHQCPGRYLAGLRPRAMDAGGTIPGGYAVLRHPHAQLPEC